MFALWIDTRYSASLATKNLSEIKPTGRAVQALHSIPQTGPLPRVALYGNSYHLTITPDERVRRRMECW
jgi:hypothetical protein